MNPVAGRELVVGTANPQKRPMSPMALRPMNDKVKREALVTLNSERHTVRLIFSRLMSGGLPATKSPTAVTDAREKAFVLFRTMPKRLDNASKVNVKVPPVATFRAYRAAPTGLPPE